MKVKIPIVEDVKVEKASSDVSLITILMRVQKMSNDNIVKNHAKGLYSRLIELQCEETANSENYS